MKLIDKYHDELHDLFVLAGMLFLAVCILYVVIFGGIRTYEIWRAEHKRHIRGLYEDQVIGDYDHERYELSSLTKEAMADMKNLAELEAKNANQ